MIKLSGFLLFLSFILSLVSYFLFEKLFIISGIIAWFSFLFLYQTIKKKLVINLLLSISLINFFIIFYKDFNIDFERVFTVNQYLLTLLIGVSFLKLITKPKKEKGSKQSLGKKAFLNTYFGVHFFGAVINMSSLIIVADKLYKKADLSKIQIITLTRAFSSDAYWSPFFVAFAAALTYMPNFDKSIVLVNGVFLALIAFIFTYIDVNKKFDISEFRGYPINFQTLYIPVILALLVLFTKSNFEELKVIILVATYSLFLTILILLFKNKASKMFNKLSDFALDELPNMKMELALFLVAGMFGVTFSSLLTGFNISLPFNEFSYIEAIITLFIFIILAFIGIHPIITIVVVSQFLSEFNHTLLAITFLMAWAITVSTSPFSGLNLAIQGRYNILAKDIFKLNLPYAIKMFLVGAVFLYFLDKILLI